jgi:uncharacterized protein (TIGR02145 family)
MEQISDIDSNTYKTIKIGNQVWMAENLNVSHYRNGDTITQVLDDNKWKELTIGAWCYIYNREIYGKTYGKLYNWYAVNDPRGLAPLGWHVPTDNEWYTLIEYLGGKDIAGGKLKEIGTTYWNSPNEGATNESGFTALPGGCRSGSFGFFSDFTSFGIWWSGSGKVNNLRVFFVQSDFIWIRQEIYPSKSGISVRCLMD